jgi:group I intron endonuclease
MVIYKTTNLINGKFYIGKDVKNSDSYFGSGILLKKSIKKYGIENFKKEILEICQNKDQLEEREKYWIQNLESIKYGYNSTEGGTGGDTFSNKPDFLKEETIKKLKNRSYSEEIINKRISNLKKMWVSGENHPNRGKKQSEVTKEKRKKSFLEKGITSPMSGKKQSEETKLKISQKKKGYPSHRKGKTHSEESKQLLRLKMLGKKISEETRLKMSLSKTGKPKEKYICPYCGKEGGGGAMKRWHFEKCKNK